MNGFLHFIEVLPADYCVVEPDKSAVENGQKVVHFVESVVCQALHVICDSNFLVDAVPPASRNLLLVLFNVARLR